MFESVRWRGTGAEVEEAGDVDGKLVREFVRLVFVREGTALVGERKTVQVKRMRRLTRMPWSPMMRLRWVL